LLSDRNPRSSTAADETRGNEFHINLNNDGLTMKTLHGFALGTRIRELSDSAKERVWIVSPYIGRWPAVSSLFGASWWKGSALQLQVITDISCATNVNRGTLCKLASRGAIRSISGVHAKIYIFDNRAIVTSANLTETAFTKRREIGVLLDELEAKETINLFFTWWNDESVPVDEDQLLDSKRNESANATEPEGQTLPKLWNLPDAPDEREFEDKGGIKGAFSRYQAFLKSYGDLALEYKSVQRLWPDGPIFMEVDAFLDFLYRTAEGTPSHEFYYKNKTRELTRREQSSEIRRWAVKFANWPKVKENMRWRAKNISTIQDLLSEKSIGNLTREDARKVANCINAMNARQLNKFKFLQPQNNSIDSIKRSWRRLLHGKEPEQDRIDKCNAELRFFGTSSIQELLGWYFPNKYPLKNGNSDAGLRFFGFHI